jgi:hypothetical protein
MIVTAQNHTSALSDSRVCGRIHDYVRRPKNTQSQYRTDYRPVVEAVENVLSCGVAQCKCGLPQGIAPSAVSERICAMGRKHVMGLGRSAGIIDWRLPDTSMHV